MLLVVMFYAGNILTGKAINDLPPFTIAFFRLLLAFLILLPLAWGSFWKARTLFWEWRRPFFWMTLSGVTFFNTFIYGSLQFTSASNVAILETLIPVVTIILAASILKEKLSKIQWGGVVLSFLGAVWVVVDGRILDLGSIDWNPGDAIMIGAIACWSVYSLLVKSYMHLFPPLAAIFVMNAVSIIILLPFVAGEWFLLGMPPLLTEEAVTGIIYLGIFPSVVALLLFNRAVHLLGASMSSIFLNLLPVFTMAGAALWLGEAITIHQVTGALLVMAGVWITTQLRPSSKEI
ncbi:EamA/RhaT family transporter [Alkalicoccus saliphilus]|jgi:drug/metabolite transporter (DMT)-like permease|uniref:EamA/RhaT family transporter n=2 Tax=Alkalicoccus saliphilus TaxID=200989 RepID=A0A2T4UA00_9BACI|nr:EamA/RhaT family transporter [Alkalicoccus saliphilus]